jgi:hypothetical protein
LAGQELLELVPSVSGEQDDVRRPTKAAMAIAVCLFVFRDEFTIHPLFGSVSHCDQNSFIEPLNDQGTYPKSLVNCNNFAKRPASCIGAAMCRQSQPFEHRCRAQN